MEKTTIFSNDFREVNLFNIVTFELQLTKHLSELGVKPLFKHIDYNKGSVVVTVYTNENIDSKKEFTFTVPMCYKIINTDYSIIKRKPKAKKANKVAVTLPENKPDDDGNDKEG